MTEAWVHERRNPLTGEWIDTPGLSALNPLGIVSGVDTATLERPEQPVPEVNPLGVTAGHGAPAVNPALVDKVRTLRLEPGEGTRLMRYTKPQEGKPGQFDALYKMAKMSGIATEGRDPGNVVEDYNGWTRNRLKALLDPARAHVAVRVTPAGLDGLLTGDRLRNTHDLDPTGEQATGRAWETDVWGAHPIYGYMAEDDEDVTGVVSAFGTIKLRLRDDVRQRVTFTYSDSNYIGIDQGNALPSSPDNPDPASVPYFTNLAGITRLTMKVDPQPRPLPELRDPKHRAQLQKAAQTGIAPDLGGIQGLHKDLAEQEGWSRWEHGDFFEAQIFGDIRAGDVEEVIFPPDAPPTAEVRARLEALGIRVRVQGAPIETRDQATLGLPAANPLGVSAGTDVAAPIPSLNEAADSVARSADAWGRFRGDEPPPLDEIAANWRKQLKGRLSDNANAHEAVRAAEAKNAENPLWQQIVSKYVPDNWVVVKPPREQGKRTRGHGLTDVDGSAQRIGGTSQVREDDALLADQDMKLVPKGERPTTSIRLGGLAALLRHEYGHSIYDNVLDVETKRALREALPNPGDDLTYYAGTGSQELVPELLAVVTDPRYNPSDWPESVQRAGRILLDALGVRGPDATPGLEEAVPEKVGQRGG